MISGIRNTFVDVVGRGGSALLAARRFKLDRYALAVALDKLSPEPRLRAGRDLLRSDDLAEVETGRQVLPPAVAIAEIMSLWQAGKEVHWYALQLLAQAPGLTREQILEIMPRSQKAARGDELVEAVGLALQSEDKEVRGIDGRQFNNLRNRELVEQFFPQIGPGGEYQLIVSPHDLGLRQQMLRQFVDRLVGRLISDEMIRPEELPQLIDKYGEVGKLIVARHPLAAPEQLGQLVCEKADYFHVPAYLNALRLGYRNAVANPSAVKWVHMRLIEDPETTADQLHRLEPVWAGPLFAMLDKKIDEIPINERTDLRWLVFELHTWLYPDLSVLIRICRDYGITMDTNAVYYKLAQRLYPEMESQDTVKELLKLLGNEINEQHMPM
jgi:hypothetical protein